MRADAHAYPMLAKIIDDGAHCPEFNELGEDQSHYGLNLLVRI
jgi:hypothetical protein